MLFEMKIYVELQKDLFFLFYALERTNVSSLPGYFHTEAQGYELLSAYDSVRWPIGFKWVSDAASRCVINRRSVIWLAAA